jgi:hypothetical protein
MKKHRINKTQNKPDLGAKPRGIWAGFLDKVSALPTGQAGPSTIESIGPLTSTQASGYSRASNKKIYLSNFFPRGTEYFHSFPIGDSSSFFNNCPPWSEELVAARPLVCAGKNVKVLVFSAVRENYVAKIMNDLYGTIIPDKNLVVLPPEINVNVRNGGRNNKIITAIKRLATPGKLVMAQPLLGKGLNRYYQISPSTTIWLNDKKNLPKFINQKYLPHRYFEYVNGREFQVSQKPPVFPCVVKVSSSSSGDGVRICRSLEDYLEVKLRFQKIKGTIIVEKYIPFKYNLGVQFGIAKNKKISPQIIGYNQQVIARDGLYLGAIIDYSHKIKAVAAIKKVLLSQILPSIRKLGWYGVGGLDVLINEQGEFYFIDSNFRMTAATAYLCMEHNGDIKQPFAIFTGQFNGSKSEFENLVISLAKHHSSKQIIRIISLTKHDRTYNFNAGLFYDNKRDLSQKAKKLLRIGVSSPALKKFAVFYN